VDIRTVGFVLGDADLGAKLIGHAKATGVRVGDGQVTVSMEADVVVEMTALSRMWVKAYDTDDDVLEDLDDPDYDDSSSSSSSGSSGSGG
jgi:hypothetical protein